MGLGSFIKGALTGGLSTITDAYGKHSHKKAQGKADARSAVENAKRKQEALFASRALDIRDTQAAHSYFVGLRESSKAFENAALANNSAQADLYLQQAERGLESMASVDGGSQNNDNLIKARLDAAQARKTAQDDAKFQYEQTKRGIQLDAKKAQSANSEVKYNAASSSDFSMDLIGSALSAGIGAYTGINVDLSGNTDTYGNVSGVYGNANERMNDYLQQDANRINGDSTFNYGLSKPKANPIRNKVANFDFNNGVKGK